MNPRRGARRALGPKPPSPEPQRVGRPRTRTGPTTSQRGYGTDHQKQRRALEPTVATGLIRCWRCGERIAPGQPWDLGHADMPGAKQFGLYSGPEHRSCNRRKIRPRQQTRPPALALFDPKPAPR